jgi:hypothetical protein
VVVSEFKKWLETAEDDAILVLSVIDNEGNCQAYSPLDAVNNGQYLPQGMDYGEVFIGNPDGFEAPDGTMSAVVLYPK